MPLTRDARTSPSLDDEVAPDREPVAEMLEISADSPVPEAARPDGSDVAPALPSGALPSGALPDLCAITAPTITDHGDGLEGTLPPGINRHVAALVSWLLLPIYVTLGPWVRARTVRMTPAAGPHRGSLPGRGKPLRLLVVGDSSVAAVGVSHTSQGLAHRMAETLSRRTGRPVSYAMHGHNSAVAGQLRDHVVPHLPEGPFTHIVLSVGANDAKNWHPAGRWRHDFGTLLYALRTRYPEATIVWSRLFDFAKLPAVPWALGQVLNMRRAIVCRLADELCIERGAHAAPLMDITHDEGLSRDGFHASALGYRMWGRHLAEFITSLERRGGAANDAGASVRISSPATLADATETPEGENLTPA